jgi:ParB family chromosome partitioning protein
MALHGDSPEARANRLASMTRTATSAPASDIAAGAGPHQGRSRLANAATIDRDRIIADPDQPRTEFDPEALQSLADSLRERGQLQPIRVRWDEGQGVYVVIVGERRWRAAALAGLRTLACIIDDQPASPRERLEAQLIENCLREDLRPVEQARAYRSLMEATGDGLRELAKRLRVSPSSISKSLTLLELPEEIRTQVDEGVLPAATAYQISQVASPQAQVALTKAAVDEGLTGAEVAEMVKAVRARRPVAPAKPEPVTVDLGDGAVRITWKKAGHSAAQMLRRALKEIQAQERGEVDAA